MLCVLSFGNWRSHQMTGGQEELFLKHWVLFSWYKMRSLGTEKGSLVIPVVSTSYVPDNPSFPLGLWKFLHRLWYQWSLWVPSNSRYSIFLWFICYFFCISWPLLLLHNMIVQGRINWFCFSKLGHFMRSIHSKYFGNWMLQYFCLMGISRKDPVS